MIKSISKFEYFLVFMFCVLCGFTASNIIPAKTYLLVLFGMLHLFKNGNIYKEALPTLYILIIGFLFIFLIHYLQFQHIDSFLLDKIVMFVGGFFVICRLGNRFQYAYFRIMYYMNTHL